ncbi:MAG: LTA synthase family protein [Succinivibrio sp.]|nr:LTA synthase family protein [Succinivibrio sp.]
MIITDLNRFETSQHLRHVFCTVALGVFFCALVFILGRICFICSFSLKAFAEMTSQEWSDFLSVAIRFDLKSASLSYAPMAVLGLLGFRHSLIRLYDKIFPTYNIIAFLFALVMTIVNYYYYQTYDRVIDVFIFAPFKEDPVAVLKTVVSDYPLFTGLFCILLAAVLYHFVFKTIIFLFEYRVPVPRTPAKQYALGILLVAVFFALIRGSFTTFPIRQINAQVSDDPLVNAAVPNGPIAFYWAYKWNREQGKLPAATIEQLRQAYANAGLSFEGDNFAQPLEFKTAENAYLEEHHPDVVVALMESMSGHQLRLDDKEQRDLLGALRKYTEQDFFFNNFVSEGNGTSDSMMRLFVGVPDLNLPTTMQADKLYILNSLKPFKDKGYHTIFITGGQGSWRNLDSFLRMQGFDEVMEMSSVRALFPDATEGTWGIDDEFVFGTVLKRLKEQHDKPLLIFCLSITNHPPYRVPGEAQPKRIELNAEEKQRFNFEGAEEVFATFRYANDQLGRMLDAIVADPQLAANTVVAYTGDHNRRGIGYNGYPTEELIGFEVPFGLHLPKGCLEAQGPLVYDQKRYGSHKDIMPTIASRVLSNATLHTLGCDLLSPVENCRFPAYNSELVISQDNSYGCVVADGRQLKILPDGHVESAQGLDCSKMLALPALQRTLYHYQAGLKTKAFPKENQSK